MKESVESITDGSAHFEKVSFPGESLWVRVIEPPHMGTMLGRIESRPVGGMHKIRHGDLVRFGWVVREYDGQPYGAWEPEGMVE